MTREDRMRLDKIEKEYKQAGERSRSRKVRRPAIGYIMPVITMILRNGPAVIVFWNDNTKTVVKKMDSDEFDVYSAVAQAIAKKMYGSTTKFHDMVQESLVVQDEDCHPEDVMPSPIESLFKDLEKAVNRGVLKNGSDNGYGMCSCCKYYDNSCLENPCRTCKHIIGGGTADKWEAK